MKIVLRKLYRKAAWRNKEWKVWIKKNDRVRKFNILSNKISRKQDKKEGDRQVWGDNGW